MKRRLVQALFVILGFMWFGYTMFDILASNMGDCLDDQWCLGRRSIAFQLIFWRGLCVAILLILAYRMFRVEPEE